MSTTKHLALEKFEPIDMPLGGAITFRPRASGVHGGVSRLNRPISGAIVERSQEFEPIVQFSSRPAQEA